MPVSLWAPANAKAHCDRWDGVKGPGHHAGIADRERAIRRAGELRAAAAATRPDASSFGASTHRHEDFDFTNEQRHATNDLVRQSAFVV